MPKKKKISDEKQSIVDELIKTYKPKTTEDIQDALKELLGPVIQGMLESEFEEHIGYPKNSHESKENDNRRNGSYPKNLKSTFGQLGVDIPRDRNSEFEPEIIPKGTRDISAIENKIISMYGKGMSQRDISDTINDIYGFNVSHELISNITDKIMDEVNKWQNRELEKCYPFVFVDCMYVSVKEGSRASKKPIYTILAYDIRGAKDILGIWLGDGSESAHFWLDVFDQIKMRGVEDIFIMSMDGLSGLEKSVESIFPETVVQRCIVHLVRNAMKFIPSKDYKPFTKDIKSIYAAVSIDDALNNFEKFKVTWSNYNGAIRVFERNWKHIEQLFQFPSYIRKIMYTTNAVESVHSSFRKVTRNKAAFPNKKAVQKVIYLRIMDMYKKWNNRPVSNWAHILNQFLLLDDFKERLEKLI